MPVELYADGGRSSIGENPNRWPEFRVEIEEKALRHPLKIPNFGAGRGADLSAKMDPLRVILDLVRVAERFFSRVSSTLTSLASAARTTWF